MSYCKRIVMSLALILSIAGLLTLGQPSAASAGAEIRATGTFTTEFVSPDINNRTQGNLDILSRYSVSTYTGSLDGTTLSVQTIARDDVVNKRAFQTNMGSFWGTLDGSKPGSFSLIAHVVADRSRCVRGVPCPPSLVPIEGTFVVVEGTGMGALEGICGGGTLHTSPTGIGSDYDYSFRFGQDCKANNK